MSVATRHFVDDRKSADDDRPSVLEALAPRAVSVLEVYEGGTAATERIAVARAGWRTPP